MYLWEVLYLLFICLFIYLFPFLNSFWVISLTMEQLHSPQHIGKLWCAFSFISVMYRSELRIQCSKLLNHERATCLRLQYTFGSAIFFKCGFLGQTSGRRIISNFWKKKNWKRLNIGGEMAVYVFTGSKSLPLDWQPYGAYTINRDDFRGNYLYGCHELTTQLISIVVLTTQHFWY